MNKKAILLSLIFSLSTSFIQPIKLSDNHKRFALSSLFFAGLYGANYFNNKLSDIEKKHIFEGNFRNSLGHSLDTIGFDTDKYSKLLANAKFKAKLFRSSGLALSALTSAFSFYFFNKIDKID